MLPVKLAAAGNKPKTFPKNIPLKMAGGPPASPGAFPDTIH